MNSRTLFVEMKFLKLHVKREKCNLERPPAALGSSIHFAKVYLELTLCNAQTFKSSFNVCLDRPQVSC